jgi:hypothetical protein
LDLDGVFLDSVALTSGPRNQKTVS